MVSSPQIMDIAIEPKPNGASRKNAPADAGLFAQVLAIQGAGIDRQPILFRAQDDPPPSPRDVSAGVTQPADTHNSRVSPSDDHQNTHDERGSNDKGPSGPTDPGQEPRAGAGVDGRENGVQPGASTEAAVNAQNSSDTSAGAAASTKPADGQPSDEVLTLVQQLIRKTTAKAPAADGTGEQKVSAKPVGSSGQLFGPNLNLMNPQIIFESGMAENFIRLLTSQFEEMKNSSSAKKDQSAPSPAPPPVGLDATKGVPQAATADATPMPKVGPAADTATDNINRIVQIVRSNLGRRQSQMTVQLDPPELGKMRLDVKLTDSNLQLNITTETAEARQMILNRMETLRSSLEQNGISLTKFEVVTRSPDAGQSQNQPSDQGQYGGNFQQPQQNFGNSSRQKSESDSYRLPEEVSATVPTAAESVPSAEALNLVA